MALINSAESQGFGFLFVSVPETDQHKKQKAGKRKGDQANQNATNHSCLLPLPLFPPNYDSKSRRVKKVFSPRRHMSSAVCECLLLAAFASTARALNVAITADYWSDVASTIGASSSVMIHVFDVADQIADDF